MEKRCAKHAARTFFRPPLSGASEFDDPKVTLQQPPNTSVHAVFCTMVLSNLLTDRRLLSMVYGNFLALKMHKSGVDVCKTCS